MLIVCPSCASTYSLTPEQLGQGRTLRCASCRETWFASPADARDEPPVEAVAAAPADETPPAGDDPLAIPLVVPETAESEAGPAATDGVPKPKRRARKPAGPRRTLRPRLSSIQISAAHLATIALVGVLTLAVTQRVGIVRLMPQTARLYAALNLPVNLRGLSFEGVRSELVMDREQSILVVEGEILGVAPGRSAVPRVMLSLRGPSGEELYAWSADAPRDTLGKGEVVPFRTRLVAPPAEGRNVVIRFAETDSRLARSH